jgi:hypothetical protein
MSECLEARCIVRLEILMGFPIAHFRPSRWDLGTFPTMSVHGIPPLLLLQNTTITIQPETP